MLCPWKDYAEKSEGAFSFGFTQVNQPPDCLGGRCILELLAKPGSIPRKDWELFILLIALVEP